MKPLLRAHREPQAQRYGLIIHHGYRPWYVTKIFWDATSGDKKIFVAGFAAGSKHNRGCAVDLSLFDYKTGEEVRMPSGYEEMTDCAIVDYAGGTPEERARCALLRQAMEKWSLCRNLNKSAMHGGFIEGDFSVRSAGERERMDKDPGVAGVPGLPRRNQRRR